MTFEPKKSSDERLARRANGRATWRRTVGVALAGTGLAVALALGSAPGMARADVLDALANEFTTAAGGGEIPTLLNQSLKLRAMGFQPTAGELAAIQDSEKYRPNQTPMIKALSAAVQGQTHRMKQAQAANQQQQQCCTVGINQYDPNNPGGVSVGPGGANLGGGSTPWQIGGQPGTQVGPAG
jgi:hypothetical protein